MKQALNIGKAFILVLIVLLATMLVWEGCSSSEGSKYIYHPLLGHYSIERSYNTVKNIEKGIEITGRTAEDLKDNECPRSLGIVTKTCTENCWDCWEEEFSALRQPDFPDDVQCIEHEDIGEVYYSDKEVVITGRPQNGHNCDSMGCTSTSHVIFRLKVKK